MKNKNGNIDKLIDIREVFRKKNPKLLKLIPHFVIQYLRRIIHEEELNNFIRKNHTKPGIVQVGLLLKEFGIKIKVTGLENIPKVGRAVVASNHPLGGLDGLALMDRVSKVRPDIMFPVNDILMNIPNSEQIFIPINKHGSNAENIKIFNETFASELLILYFPAGFVSRKYKKKITDLTWKKTFISKSKQYKRDIIPTHVDGKNSNFFYNLANFRKYLGIKANLEMLYLVNEMYNQKGNTIKITFGKPISYHTFDNRFTYTQWAEKVKEHVYLLEKEPNTDFNY